MKTLRIKKIAPAQTKHLTMVGKTVTVGSPDGKWLGVVKAFTPDAMLQVSPALMRDGHLLVDWSTHELVHPAFAEPFAGVHVEACKMKAWEERSDIRNTKKVMIPDENGMVIDYKDVTINGYLSTFESMTKADRDGDYVKATAFDKSVGKFSKNPVMLMDHKNDIEHLAGSFTGIQKDGNGLAVIGKVSNAPELRKVRFLVAEGHLKSLSMGGLFLYGQDGKSINEVDLWEGSLVPVPANPDARFAVRSLDPVISAKALRRHMHFHHEVRGV
jgi:HK97 family phage prohead protease